MKAERPYPQIAITPKGEAALTGGHPWVYEGEVTSVTGSPADGDLVDVVSRRGSWLGAGFYNSRSLIRVRLLSRNPNDRFDPDFWARRVKYAWDYRKTVMAPEELTCCRVIFGEADHFPGLTVDRFGPVLVAQVLCLGLDRVKDTIFSQLVRVLREDGQDIAGIYERNDVALRDKEGMAQGKGWYPLAGEPLPDFTRTDIVENGIRYTVDFENGQKTGFFLDQKYNRQAVARLARGKTVLDCFTHTGSFALNAARGGAARVTAVDVSEFAVECARENAARNGLSQVVDCVAANVFDLLPQLQKGQYDFIILDPPAFTKSRQTTQRAMAGYKEINYRAMRLLPRGGYLATCSCSHFATEELFLKMLRSAAKDAGVQLRLECAQLMARQGHPEPTGQAKVTQAYNLPCQYVLHTVGPIITGRVTSRDEVLLAACYRACLEAAQERGIPSVAFCCISTGEFHFPNRRAAEIALKTVRGFQKETSSQIEVIFNVYKHADLQIYRELLGTA